MTRLRKILGARGRTTLGIQLALAMIVPGKALKAAGESPQEKQGPEAASGSVSAPPDPTGRFDFSRLIEMQAHPEVIRTKAEGRDLARLADSAWNLAVRAAKRMPTQRPANSPEPVAPVAAAPQPVADAPVAQAQPPQSTPMMTQEEVRLFLQSFNAGPYALLKYQGNVPYRETQNYFPRVMKYYQQDLSDNPYDEHIVASATKYGLDPQLIRAVMKTESSFRNETVSHAGARGLMQVMPVVWKDVKAKYNLSWDYETEVFEPAKNIEVACAYLAWLRYDFLPRHFEVFDPNPAAPTILVRDSDRGVPDRESPRIVVAAADAAPMAPLPGVPESAQSVRHIAKGGASSDDRSAAKDETQAKPASVKEVASPKREVASVAKKPEIAGKAKPEIKLAFVDETKGKVVSRSTAGDGKTRVVIRGGKIDRSGSSSKPKVTAKTETKRIDSKAVVEAQKDAVAGKKKAEVADASAKGVKKTGEKS